MVRQVARRLPPDGETESRILEAAKRVFIRRGTAGARMQEIADEAGVNQALLHYYFRSKERLSEAVFSRVAAPMFGAIIHIIGSDIAALDKIDRIVDTYLNVLTASPFLPGYILAELHHHPERIPRLLGNIAGGKLSDVASPAFDKLEKQLAAAARAGQIRRTTAAQFVVNILSLCVFPFAARPMLRAVLDMSDDEFAKFIEHRRKELPAYIRAALRP
ncbi:MAG TPA: helix-turn-helix domain-containing protein [Gemmatimonadaceae bacterium]|nr:helix-turn-helix domain-containing protein [Gemmatimonadaceae bacterium]